MKMNVNARRRNWRFLRRLPSQSARAAANTRRIASSRTASSTSRAMDKTMRPVGQDSSRSASAWKRHPRRRRSHLRHHLYHRTFQEWWRQALRTYCKSPAPARRLSRPWLSAAPPLSTLAYRRRLHSPSRLWLRLLIVLRIARRCISTRIPTANEPAPWSSHASACQGHRRRPGLLGHHHRLRFRLANRLQAGLRRRLLRHRRCYQVRDLREWSRRPSSRTLARLLSPMSKIRRPRRAVTAEAA